MPIPMKNKTETTTIQTKNSNCSYF